MKKDIGEAPLGIGGWLILVGIRLIVSAVSNGNSVIRSFGLHLNTIGVIIIILSLLYILYALFVLALFFKRHKAFPAAYIVFEALSVILNISTLIITYKPNTLTLEGFWLPAAQPLICILWILYILRSRRVKKTFVLNWNKKPDQDLVDKVNGRQL